MPDVQPVQPSADTRSTAIAVAASLVSRYQFTDTNSIQNSTTGKELFAFREAHLKWQQEKIVEIAAAILSGTARIRTEKPE